MEVRVSVELDSCLAMRFEGIHALPDQIRRRQNLSNFKSKFRNEITIDSPRRCRPSTECKDESMILVGGYDDAAWSRRGLLRFA
jgi:hypothetical protein